MFTRVTKVKSGGQTYEYLQIVEAYRHNGRPKQRVVANRGRLDRLGSRIDDLIGSLRKHSRKTFVGTDQITSREALPWGPVLLSRHLWEQMDLPAILRRCCRSSRKRFDVAETAFVLVANRLGEPRSEHGLARWLEHTFVCDAQGRRWEPDWLAVEQITKQQRVKVHHRQLDRWYRTLDALLAAQPHIEEALYARVRDLFSVKVDLVFYDLTTTYFARRSPKGRLRRHGCPKHGKPRQVQVVLGVVMANGWPIAHHVFPGNQAESKTLRKVLMDLDRRFGLGRVMVISDRGLTTPENLAFLSETPFRYLLGVRGRRSNEARAVLDALQENRWVHVDEGNQAQEVKLADRSGRYFVIESRERKAYEESLRARSMQRAGEGFKKIAAAVEAGRLKDPAKIGARAARAASRHHGHRYYSWEVPGRGQFRFFEDPAKLEAETRHEEKYLLKTDDADLGPIEAVAAYKQLSTVESGFRDLKDVIDMRPIYHKRDDRVRAHILVASLALFLKRTLEHQLADQLPELSGTEAFAAMRSIGLSELTVGDEPLRLVPRGGRDAHRVLSAMGITDTKPPTPQNHT